MGSRDNEIDLDQNVWYEIRIEVYEYGIFVYIDGNHKFDFICPDIIYWSKKVKHGGIVAVHDFYGGEIAKILFVSPTKASNSLRLRFISSAFIDITVLFKSKSFMTASGVK